ncbi:MAG: GTPase Era [Candidatus Omnitrophota bacterium]
MKKKFKSGYVAFLGKPNVGKSTLLNHFLKEKLCIISPKPQTTRDSIQGILSEPGYQIIFVDTPGIHQPKTALGKHMNDLAQDAGIDADVMILIVDASTGITYEDRQIFNWLKSKYKAIENKRVMILINKIDLIEKNEVLPIIAKCQRELAQIKISDYIPVSAIDGDNLDLIFGKMLEYLPFGPVYYPEDQLTDKNERYVVAELIREQVLGCCREEVPHSVAVLVQAMQDNPGRKTLIQATVYVEKKTQKGIIIGEKGQMLKTIGSLAREQIEGFLGRKVYLELWVRVQDNWRKDEAFLKKLGYGDK